MPSYLEYDRDRSRSHLFRHDLTAEDLQASNALINQIPPDVMERYRQAFAFRHPSVVTQDDFAKVESHFLHTAVPSHLIDLLADPLLNPVSRSCVSCSDQPVLADDLSTSPTTFKRYALLEVQGIAASRSALLRDQLDHAPIDQELEAIPEDLCNVYLQYLGFYYPELLSNLEDDDQTLLLQRWSDRDFTSLY